MQARHLVGDLRVRRRDPDVARVDHQADHVRVVVRVVGEVRRRAAVERVRQGEVEHADLAARGRLLDDQVVGRDALVVAGVHAVRAEVDQHVDLERLGGVVDARRLDPELDRVAGRVRVGQEVLPADPGERVGAVRDALGDAVARRGARERARADRDDVLLAVALERVRRRRAGRGRRTATPGGPGRVVIRIVSEPPPVRSSDDSDRPLSEAASGATCHGTWSRVVAPPPVWVISTLPSTFGWK